MKNKNVDNNSLNFDKSVHVSDRAKRLLKFLSKYKELWYENGRGLEEKINMITINEREKKKIIDLYNQAEEDFAILRAVRTRFYEHQKGKHTTPEYRISESQLESLRQAGVGRTFGLSDKNQAEYDRLVKAGVDEDIVEFIFKKFTSYDRFKEIFREAIEQGRELDVLRKCPKATKYYVSDIDLSGLNGVSTVDRNYVELLRDILGVRYFVFDGEKLTSRLNDFIDFKEKKSRDNLSINERDIIRKIYGIDREKMTSDEIRKSMGLSNSRVRQILKKALSKLSNRRHELFDVVYLSEEREAAKLLSSYYKKNDVFRSNKEIKLDESSKQYIYENDIDLDEEIYCNTFAQKLKTQVDELRHSRDEVSHQYKVLFDTLLDDFENMRIEDFYIGRTLIDRLGLSRKLCSNLSSNGIITIGDAITYSRNCDGLMKENIKNIKRISYDDFVASFKKLGLKLEDEDKSDETRRNNDKILSHMSRDNAAKFALYLEQIRYRARACIMKKELKEQIENRINFIKEKYGIYISNDDLVDRAQSRIRNLDCQYDYTTNLDVLDVPHEVLRVLNLHGINKVIDIYRIGNRGTNYVKKKYRLYLDMIVAELNRMGLNYPIKETQVNVMKHASYVNKMNIELITFLIEESDLSNTKKQELEQELFDKVKQIEDDNKSEDIDKKLSDRIEKLKSSYQILNSKRKKLIEIKSNLSKKDTRCDNQEHDDID